MSDGPRRLFPGHDPLLPITTRRLYRAVRDGAEAAGLEKWVSPTSGTASAAATPAHT